MRPILLPLTSHALARHERGTGVDVHERTKVPKNEEAMKHKEKKRT